VILNKKIVIRFIFFSILAFGYLNAVLRVSPESKFTLFRILIPLIFIYTLFDSFFQFRKFYIIFLVLLIYGFINSVFISKWHSFNFAYFLHYATLLLLFFLVKVYSNKFGFDVFYKHLKQFYFFMVFMGFIQILTKIPWPNVELRDSPNIFFSVENDYAAALGVFIPFLIIDKTGNKYINWLIAFAGFYIIIIAEARIAMISIILFLFLILWDRFKIIGSIIFILFLNIGYNVLNEIDLGGNNFFELFIDPINHIVNLEPYNIGGSIYDRTDALINGIISYKETLGFGIGPGNTSANLFKDPEYRLATAESMHNFFAQVIVEYGWLMVIGFFLIFFYIKKIRSNAIFENNNAFKYYIFSVILTSLSQSEGLFSNYFFFVTIYFSIYYFNIKYLNKSVLFNKSNLKQ
jgi:teichuronic acid biosynthesis protein TuaE